jgi:hypothetical protein
MTSPRNFYTWTRENAASFKPSRIGTYFLRAAKSKFYAKKIRRKISLSYAIPRGRLELFRLTQL